MSIQWGVGNRKCQSLASMQAKPHAPRLGIRFPEHRLSGNDHVHAALLVTDAADRATAG